MIYLIIDNKIKMNITNLNKLELNKVIEALCDYDLRIKRIVNWKFFVRNYNLIISIKKQNKKGYYHECNNKNTNKRNFK